MPLAILCLCSALLVSDLVRVPEDQFSCVTAQSDLKCAYWFFGCLSLSMAYRE